MNVEKFYKKVFEERERQKKLWGDNQSLHNYVWLGILTEELGEVAKAINKEDSKNLQEELIQICAVIEAWITQK